MSAPNASQFVRVRDLVEGPNPILPITRQTLRRWIKQGVIPPPRRFGPRMIFWPADEIHEFVKNLGVKAPEPEEMAVL